MMISDDEKIGERQEEILGEKVSRHPTSDGGWIDGAMDGWILMSHAATNAMTKIFGCIH